MQAGLEHETLVIFRLPICNVKCCPTRDRGGEPRLSRRRLEAAIPMV